MENQQNNQYAAGGGDDRGILRQNHEGTAGGAQQPAMEGRPEQINNPTAGNAWMCNTIASVNL